MEPNKIYSDLIINLSNALKNDDLKQNSFKDPELKKQYTLFVDNLLALEINHSCLYKDKKWSSNFGKTLVNLYKEKIKFIKPDNKKIEDILSDLIFFQTFCFNNYKIEREKLNDNHDIDEEIIKSYSILPEGFIKTSNNEENVYVEPEVVDKDVEQPNYDSNNNSSNAFNASKVLLHPLQDQRFYPYNSKPKNTKLYKMILMGLFSAFVILYFIITGILNFSKYNIESADTFKEWGFNNEFIEKFSNFEGLNWPLSYSFSIPLISSVMGVLSILIIFLFSAYVAYLLIQPPRNYKDKYLVPWFIPIAIIFIVGMITYNFIGLFQFYFGKSNVTSTSIANILGQSVMGFKTTEEIANWLKDASVSDAINNMTNSLNSSLAYGALKVMFWIFFTIEVLCGGMAIFVIVINPRLDKNKLIKANNEYNNYINAAMQGKSYDIDKSLYESDEEISEFMNTIKNHKNKKNKNEDKDSE
ncbi:hypothetical protein [Spiroplasma turonicum]|uniref:Transmembrane protein n=1 Tax=Spiroplasma turonicum TaxID=216946 RepID=A0A0K1P6A6_9MOLU|nr:hypothetical protein [Spiroplasma turonicum]AKU79719.1 hypothetical protein STURON_00473 [Spiroplasma turonicum]ALX70737.1 hypothetical protein STURO_v1c04710 [Spiroplasma turonicum]